MTLILFIIMVFLNIILNMLTSYNNWKLKRQLQLYKVMLYMLTETMKERKEKEDDSKGID